MRGTAFPFNVPIIDADADGNVDNDNAILCVCVFYLGFLN